MFGARWAAVMVEMQAARMRAYSLAASRAFAIRAVRQKAINYFAQPHPIPRQNHQLVALYAAEADGFAK
ncbi:hypothetical protein [Achromobacter anxifer]|uniref:hypothetical protein n=1 Tax=Achromobacter anxifer TaxID=1287737 RepID=UPI0015841C59|nr:hypothetical protein [Achromobacter anxifer]